MLELNFKRISREMSGREGLAGSTIMLSIAALIIVFLLWASWAKLDNVTRGEGRIISSIQNQMVQASEGGVVLRRLVSEGSLVSEGDILFEIDPIDASSELNRVEQRLAALDIKELRLRSEIDGEDFTLTAKLSDRAPMVALAEKSLFVARRTELAGQLSVIGQRLQQRKQDELSAQNQADMAQRTAALLQEEIDVVAPLVTENIAPATRLLELQRQLEQANGEDERAQGGAKQAISGMLELDMEAKNSESNYRLRAMDELNTLVADQNELRQALPRLKERVSRTVIRSPMEGIVNKLSVRTAGAVVGAGDVVLELVPTSEALIVEARIMPKDISRIRVGDAVRIRLSAYDSSKYGTVAGSVARISADASADDRNGASSHYLVDVSIDGNLVLNNGEKIQFIPGMTASVDVLSGKRTVLEYFWQPIARVQELALRD